MGNAFGKKKKNRKKRAGSITAQDRAVLDLKNARDKLRRFQSKLDAESEQLTKRASQLLRDGKKDRALLTLKFRRFRQDKANQVDGQLLRLEDMVSAIRWEERQSEVISALREGTDALKALHEDMGDVAALMDETQDQLEMERKGPLLSGETTDDSTRRAMPWRRLFRSAGGAVVAAGGARQACRRRHPCGAPRRPEAVACPRDQIKFHHAFVPVRHSTRPFKSVTPLLIIRTASRSPTPRTTPGTRARCGPTSGRRP